MIKIIVLVVSLTSFTPIVYGQQLDAVSSWATIAGSEIRMIPNVVYDVENNVKLRLDVITLDKSEKPRPTLIYIHGGGWTKGSKEQYQFEVLPFLAHGMNAVNVEYRLASESLAPAAVEDCRCALRWIYDHAKEYGFDTSKLVVEGHSAGGHLSLMTGMLSPDAGFDNGCPGNSLKGNREPMKVAAIVNYFGITNVAELLQGPDTRSWAVKWLGSQPNRLELARRLSPLTYVRKKLPPIITLQGDEDPTVPYSQGVQLHEALNAVGVPNELITILGGRHGRWSREEELRGQAAVFSFLEAQGVLSR